jgi:uncharacterized protein YbbC (DUF1343 family)
MKNILLFFFVLLAFRPLQAKVKQGIDSFETVVSELKGKRVALLTHAAAVNNRGTHLIDLAFNSLSELKVIFAPEHGVRSRDDDYVDDDIDATTGVQIISLYKSEQRAPRDVDLKKFDALIIDLKDVGVRFYTYATTTYLTIKKSIESNKEIYLLDRVNPLGTTVSGPVLDASLTGHMISYFALPMSHGLTLGEYMNYVFDKHPKKHLIKIVKNSGWHRSMLWHDTSLEWIAPSPALASFEQSYLYSIFGSFESLNISVGRSKDNLNAFRFFGAPWISKKEMILLISKLGDLNLKGVLFSPVEWKVNRGIYKGEIARGFKVNLIDYALIDRYEVMFKSLQAFYQLFKSEAKFNHWAKRYLGSELMLTLLKSNTNYDIIKKQVRLDERAFRTTVAPFLLY